MMKTLLIFFLAAAPLFIQTIHTAPTDSNEQMEKAIDDVVNIFKQIAEHFEILDVTFDELIDLDSIVREEGMVLFNKVLSDPKLLEIKNDAMEKVRNEVREYLDNLENGDMDTSRKAIEYLNFEDVVNKFKKEKVENITPEAEAVGKSFKENGLEDLEKKVKDHFTEFMKKFVKQIDNFIAKLSEDDKKDEKRLLDWYDKSVAETDIDKKIQIFDEFFVSVSKNSVKSSKED